MDNKQKYFSILESLNENGSKSAEPNDKILWCDGLNTFIRNFVANPTVNENGAHIGGLAGFMKSLGYAIRMTNPTRVVVCFDGKGGSAKRRKIYPDYKSGRKIGGERRMTRLNSFSNVEEEKMSMRSQMQRLTQYLDTLPITVVSVENIEADDAIAYGVRQIFPESEHVIMSTDKDYLQLIDDKVSVWSPTKKKYYNQETFIEDHGVPAYNYLTYKSMIGDNSDSIPGIKGCGLKTLQKRLPILFGDKPVTIEDVLKYSSDNKDEAKILEVISESGDLLNLNYALMQLEEVDISARAKTSIINQIERKMEGLVKYRFQVLMLEDMLNVAIKNPEFWLKDTFAKLDGFVKILNEGINE